MRIRKIILAAAVLGLTTVGCSAVDFLVRQKEFMTRKQHVATFISPAINEKLPARIVIVPFDGENCSAEARRAITRSMALAIQKILRSDTVIASSVDESLLAESGVCRLGRIDISALIKARKEYSADAFVFGTVTHYRAYDPPVIGLRLHMIAGDTGDPLWSSEALFDAHDYDVRYRATEYYKSSGLKDRLYGPDLMFVSPSLFSRFVAHEVVEPLSKSICKSEARREDRGK